MAPVRGADQRDLQGGVAFTLQGKEYFWSLHTWYLIDSPQMSEEEGELF